jgi:hypothetical protein
MAKQSMGENKKYWLFVVYFSDLILINLIHSIVGTEKCVMWTRVEVKFEVFGIYLVKRQRKYAVNL